ncbi:type 2 periplasmic-binding domain-containing protein [Fulvivirga lutea]|uniref:Uracil-DNA glycosylase n=1 Tax=Fulvivirga lutea TaxID=2810512 RepID=A0A974WDT2_9BACT|nr:uracil-DNA glycosylase [Fulvivirga lutea]QSE96344.1 uracil-DNA glycosylase [Fulvivirga lutea]
MNKTRLRVGGVPEHFNLPVHLAIENGDFSRNGIEVIWEDYPGGTGAMTQALRNNEVDICILLTEGIVADIIKGNPSKIISGYVKTPLTWGIHTFIDNESEVGEALFTEKIAISRKGSGSHLMPIVDALMQGKSLSEEQFIIIKDIHGALKSLDKRETGVFYWEKYTTKPFVKNGNLKRIGEFNSPWPCFMIAATNEIIEREPNVLDTFLKVLHNSCEQFMNNSSAPEMVSKRYELDYKDSEYWYHSTEWAADSWVTDKTLVNVVFALKEAQLIPKDSSTANLIWKRNSR